MVYAQNAVRVYAANARKLVDDLLTYSSAVMGAQRPRRGPTFRKSVICGV
jgi:hypothetical protein